MALTPWASWASDRAAGRRWPRDALNTLQRAVATRAYMQMSIKVLSNYSIEMKIACQFKSGLGQDSRMRPKKSRPRDARAGFVIVEAYRPASRTAPPGPANSPGMRLLTKAS